MDSIAWLTQLISFDTTSRYSNLALIDYLQQFLKNYPINIRITRNKDQTKANLFATLPGKNGKKTGGLILSGHTDVVPVDGQVWDTHPFRAIVKDEKIYGRGAADMKGFLAVILTLIPDLLLENLNQPLHLAFSYDEEVGCLGVPDMIADFQKAGIRPAFCIVGEPTERRLVLAHKGIQAYRCQVKGLSAHSSLTSRACNAIEYAALTIHKIKCLAEALKHESIDSLFDVPFTSITTNLIAGGTASNIIPNSCEFTFEFRNLPKINPEHILSRIKYLIEDDILPHMKQAFKDAAIEVIALDAVPSFEAAENSAFVQFIQNIIHDKTPLKVSYATEAGLFQQSGIETVLLGPGSIHEAHRPNEFIALSELKRCEAQLKHIITAFQDFNH